ncbi:hypothetical protein [Escherichia coli]|nr:hypothetical protein [Escherichia coli]
MKRNDKILHYEGSN